MWIILAVLFSITTLLSHLVIKDKNDEIKALEYAISSGASDEVLMKAVEEYNRY